ncbi:hypothetical protein QG37_04364 [Candidozyma auris]|uniref:Uncharacterized protein n=1 Tax=Candidozyma auris TaxID=498019 RepID=A0A0L0NWR3_CANAR|nr:hypothetical protein QG37_04364 [[Candida] auris]
MMQIKEDTNWKFWKLIFFWGFWLANEGMTRRCLLFMPFA